PLFPYTTLFRSDLAGRRDGDARVAVRRLQLRHRAQRQAGILGTVPPGSLTRPARQPLPVRAVHAADAQAQRTVANLSNVPTSARPRAAGDPDPTIPQ